jgi:hypothetical protein
MQFSLAELLSVMVIVCITAACTLRNTHGEMVLSTLVAVSMGLAATGPWILLTRRRAGTLSGRWGIGELAWLSLGFNCWALFAVGLLAPQASLANHWLALVGILSAATIFAALIIALSRMLTAAIGGKPSGGRPWFIRRWTNAAGIVLLMWFIVLEFLLSTLGHSWLPF